MINEKEARVAYEQEVSIKTDTNHAYPGVIPWRNREVLVHVNKVPEIHTTASPQSP